MNSSTGSCFAAASEANHACSLSESSKFRFVIVTLQKNTRTVQSTVRVDEVQVRVGRYPSNAVTHSPFTSSRGWFKWLYTMVSGLIPTAW